jgi:hypothetical protein
MSELTGNPGFAPPPDKKTIAGRRAAAIEMAATVGLTISLVIAVTAVSLGNRSLMRAQFLDRAAGQTPMGALLDHADVWFSPTAPLSLKAQQ